MLPSGIYCICVKTSHRLVNIYRWHTLPSSAILTSDQWRIYMGAKGGPGPPTPKIFFKKNSNKNKIMLLILFICLGFAHIYKAGSDIASDDLFRVFALLFMD